MRSSLSATVAGRSLRRSAPEFPRGRVCYRSPFQPTEVSADTRFSLELGEKSTLVGVERDIPALGHAADVVPRSDPLPRPDQLEREFSIVESTEIYRAETLEAMVPVVSVDEERSPTCHCADRKKPRRVMHRAPDPGGMKPDSLGSRFPKPSAPTDSLSTVDAPATISTRHVTSPDNG